MRRGEQPQASRPLAIVMPQAPYLSPIQISEIVEMALSDHISFTLISAQHGVSPDQIKAIMRTHLKQGSYQAWRKRVRDFGDRREHYK